MVVSRPLPAATASYEQTAGGGLTVTGEGPDAGRYRVGVLGDLGRATRVAVVVPGAGNDVGSFTTSRVGPWANARNLYAQAQRQHRASGLAVVAWLGYVPPASVADAAFHADGIDQGAANLAALQTWLAGRTPGARVTWVCHSWGSLVCAAALRDAQPAALVLVGSPGVEYADVLDMPFDGPVYAGRGAQDLIRYAGLLSLLGVGFGPDPADPAFGAVAIPTDPGCQHSGYFTPGSAQLDALVRVVSTAA